MVALAYSYQPSFVEVVTDHLDKVDYRVAESAADREAIFRQRYEAYRREGTIEENSSGLFRDEFDDIGKVFLLGAYYEGRLVSSVRIHVIDHTSSISPTLHVFEDYLQPEIDSGKIIVDSTRFVTDQKSAREIKGLAHITLRLCWMAVRHFEADHFLAAVRREHQAFYRRTFDHRVVCPPRTYPMLNAPICLMSVSYSDAAKKLQKRYPFYYSNELERRILFDKQQTNNNVRSHNAYCEQDHKTLLRVV